MLDPKNHSGYITMAEPGRKKFQMQKPLSETIKNKFKVQTG